MRIKVFKIGKFLTTVSVICMILVTTLHISSNSFKYSIFKDPKDIEDWPDHIQIIILLKGLNDPNGNGDELREKFNNFLRSVVIHARIYPIRFIFQTDIKSVFQIEKSFEDILPPFQLTSQINGKTLPRFHREYVNIENIENLVDNWSEVMNMYFNHPNLTFEMDNYHIVYNFKQKFNHLFFYITPYYQRLYTKLKKVIIMDADLEFRVDPAELYDEFHKFSVENILGCAVDQAPYYYMMLNVAGFYEKNPKSILGTPGQFQGLNGGVLLLRLDRMRENVLFNHYLSTEGITELAFRYGFTKTSLGAQDWYSMVNFDSPNLIYPLDCKFNRQMSKYNDEYSACHNKNTYDKDNTFIIHLNGNHQWKNFNDYLIESYIETKFNILK